MLKAEPEKLLLDYTQTMMGFLLFQPTPQRMAMIGLGGGSLAKYCRRTLPTVDFTAIELSAEVIALRE
ncbi:transferase, partial [bacterium]|nr:transferase [bacterium]